MKRFYTLHISVFMLIIMSIAYYYCNCAIAPKYRSAGIRSSKVKYDPNYIPKELINAPSLMTVEGVSSWYGEEFDGKQTSNGEIFDKNKLSAAHKDFPLGTWLRVTNLKNNRTIIVKVNDRGPFIEGRILDLSKKAADELGFLIEGLAKVRIEVLRWGTDINY